MTGSDAGIPPALHLVPSIAAGEPREEPVEGAGQRRHSVAVHPSAGRQKLRILVEIDAEGDAIRVIVRGCLTPLNIHGLDLVVCRASALNRDSDIIVDISRTSCWGGMDAWLQADAIERRLQHYAPRSSPGHHLSVVSAAV